MEVKSNVLDRQYFRYKTEYEQKVKDVLESGFYILGPELVAFETEFAEYIGTKHCVGLASGLDALWIGLRLFGIKQGDEVLVQSNAYIATVMSITMNGATPVFVEPDVYYNMDADKIESAITNRTKAIIVTHLYGQPTACMERVQAICKAHKLYLIEDCAQSHGAKYHGKMTGTFGDLGCFSFYPSKNLGGFGDGGAITTNNANLAQQFKIFRNYGSEKRYYNKMIGANSRLDEIQAALLRIKLSHLDELQQERNRLVRRYLNEIKNPLICLPKVAEGCEPVWHLFVVRVKQPELRNQLIKHLESKHIHCLIHYPVPPHLQEAYRDLGYHEGDFPLAEQYAATVVSLPLYNGMTDAEIDYVISAVNSFKERDVN